MPRTALPKTSARLREALELLALEEKITVSKLCALANVSRNTVYKYHPEILAEVQLLRSRSKTQETTKPANLDRLSEQNKALALQVSQLVSLVDHYFSAWQETAALLHRRDRELAEVRRELGAQLKAVKEKFQP